MNHREVSDFNARLAAESAAEQAKQQADDPSLEPAPEAIQLPRHSGVTDPVLLAEIRANHARAVRIEALPWWRRLPAQVSDSLDLAWVRQHWRAEFVGARDRMREVAR